jgi:hypothetical protein
MSIDHVGEKAPHSVRSAMLILSKTRRFEHGTPDGVRCCYSPVIYKHGTPAGVGTLVQCSTSQINLVAVLPRRATRAIIKSNEQELPFQRQ